jgi:hypothetical protein
VAGGASPVLIYNDNLNPAVLLASGLGIIGRHGVLFTEATGSNPVATNPVLD